MARNVELKANDRDPTWSLEASLSVGARDQGCVHQTDTYFCVPKGRLKLREQDGVAELIHYEREDKAVERESRYTRVPVENPAELKAALTAALGIKVVVEKTRRLLLWHNVRIHLDEVAGIGSFVELEAVAEPDSDLDAEYASIAHLRDALEITDERIVASGYGDELLRVGG